jgi:hypothetical protein
LFLNIQVDRFQKQTITDKMVFIFKITLPNTQTKKTVSPASERDHWLRMIEECRAVDCGELERMACEELGVDLKEHVGTTRRRVSSLSSSSQGKTSGDVEMTDAGIEEGGDNDSDKTVEKKAGGTAVTAGAKSSATAEETIDAYLLGNIGTKGAGASHRDPAHHEAILQKLLNDLETRSDLVQQLSTARASLREVQSKRDSLTKFLADVPRRLADMEKCSEGLESFFAGHNQGNDDGGYEVVMAVTGKRKLAAAMPTSKRTRRFRLASSRLPPALYALFVQLSRYADAFHPGGGCR